MPRDPHRKALPDLVVFFDSDVVISSILSQSGAAYRLTQEKRIERFISNLSKMELTKVAERLKIPEITLTKHLKEYFSEIRLSSKVVQKYAYLVFDPQDCHIVAAAKAAQAQYIATYDLKDYRADLIKSELSMLVMSPGQILQLMRSF